MASNKRERELARMRAERQAARRAAAEAQHKQRRNAILIGVSTLVVVAIVAVVAVVLGTGGSTKKKTDTVAPSSGFGNLGGTGSCTYTKTGTSAKKISGLPPTSNILAKGTQNVTLALNSGTLKLNLNTAAAPCTVNSFYFLAQQDYFNDTKCHRLVTSGIYVLQCGDPTATGTGGPGYKFADENLTGATYPAGTLAMANSGAGTNGSQFFIVYKASQLPPSYTPFGKVTSGLSVVTKIAAGGSDNSNNPGDGKPKIATSITKVTV